jgi:hypothetical protein
MVWACVLGCVSASTGYADPGAVDPAALMAQAFANRHRIDAFREISAQADRAGMEIYLVGGVAAGYVNRLRLSMQNRSHALARLPARDLRLEQVMNPLGVDVDVAVRFKDGRPMKWADADGFRLRLTRALPYLAFDVQPLGGTDRLPGFTSPDYLATHHDTTDFLMVQLNGTRADRVVRDAREWDRPSASPTCLRDLAAGQIRLHLSKKPATPPGRRQPRPRGEMRAIFRILNKAMRFDLRVAPESRAEIARGVQRFDPDTMDRHTRAWLLANGKKLFDPTNLNRRPLELLGSFPTLVDKLSRSRVKGVERQIEALRQRPIQRAPHLSSREMIKTLMDVDALTDVRRLLRDTSTPRRRAYFIKRLQTRAPTRADLSLFRRLARGRLERMTESNASCTLESMFACRRLHEPFPDLRRDFLARLDALPGDHGPLLAALAEHQRDTADGRRWLRDRLNEPGMRSALASHYRPRRDSELVKLARRCDAPAVVRLAGRLTSSTADLPGLDMARFPRATLSVIGRLDRPELVRGIQAAAVRLSRDGSLTRARRRALRAVSRSAARRLRSLQAHTPARRH